MACGRSKPTMGPAGSLQAAADELGVSIGAVSQQIIKTEAQLGHAMFERTGKGLVPTELGTGVLARLSEGFQKLSEAVALAQRRDNDCLTISVARSSPRAGSYAGSTVSPGNIRKSSSASTRRCV